MVRSGAASTICETQTPPRSWGGFGKSPPLQTSATVRLSVQFLHEDEPTASLAVWAYIVPPEAMQHDVLLGRDSWMRFGERSYRTLPPRPRDNRVFGELTLSHQTSTGAAALVSDFSAPAGGYHLLYAGDDGISLSRDHQLVQVSLVRNNRAPALSGSYLVEMLPGSPGFSVDEHLVENGLQHIPLAGTVELEPGDLLDTSPCPLLRVPVASVLHHDDSASTLRPITPDGPHMAVPGPVTPPSAGIFTPPTCADPFVHHLHENPPRGGPELPTPTTADLEPPPSLLARLTAEQRVSFLQVWYKLPAHLREISFDFHGPGWDPTVITQLGDALTEFADVFPGHPPTLARAPSCRSRSRSPLTLLR